MFNKAKVRWYAIAASIADTLEDPATRVAFEELLRQSTSLAALEPTSLAALARWSYATGHSIGELYAKTVELMPVRPSIELCWETTKEAAYQLRRYFAWVDQAKKRSKITLCPTAEDSSGLPR